MKRRFILLFFAFSLCLSATDVFSQEFKGGAFLGLNLSQVDGDDMAGYNKIGANGGFFVNRMISRESALQAELFYSMKGSSVKSTKNTSFQREISSSYVDLSLYYKYFFTEQLAGKVGLTPSVLISHKETYMGNELNADNIPKFRKFTAQFSIGAEYFLTENWFANLTFNYSIISLREGGAEFSGYNNMHFVFENGQFYNYLSFSLGYQF